MGEMLDWIVMHAPSGSPSLEMVDHLGGKDGQTGGAEWTDLELESEIWAGERYFLWEQ